MRVNSILLTGASGFLGQAIQKELFSKYEIATLGRSVQNRYVVDLGMEMPVFKESFDMVIHAAGRAHQVPRNTGQREAFYRDNLQASKNLLTALERNAGLPAAFVFISTVSVYGQDHGEMISEDHPLEGTSPYARSKIEAEGLINNWCKERNVIPTVLRLPLVVGENPKGNLGAMIRMMKRGIYFGIGNGAARKSMVLAEDVARYIPDVARIGGTYNLTDGFHPSILELEISMMRKLNRGIPYRISNSVIQRMAQLGNLFGERFPLHPKNVSKLTSTLTFSDLKARNLANWNSQVVINNLPKLI